MIVHLGSTPISTRFGKFILSGWYDGIAESYSIHCGSIEQAENVPVRVHSSCIVSHYFQGISCDCVAQMSLAQKYIQDQGIGLVIVLQQEAKGNGILATLSLKKQSDLPNNSFIAFERNGFEGDARTYHTAAEIIDYFNIKSIELLSNSPKKREALKDYGINVSKMKVTQDINNQSLQDFYLGKEKFEGHIF